MPRQRIKSNDSLESSETLCISVPTAARLLGISRNTAYEMARLGQLPVLKCGQRRLVVPKAALKRMLEEASGKL
jgi:excisionase family DNA binding protein